MHPFTKAISLSQGIILAVLAAATLLLGLPWAVPFFWFMGFWTWNVLCAQAINVYVQATSPGITVVNNGPSPDATPVD